MAHPSVTAEAALARVHGLANVVGGAWPLLSMRTFEAVFGPKTDRWLVQTVAGLLIANGWAQLRAPASPDGLGTARRIGLGTAATLGAIDLRYAVPGRISRMYLLDAVVEATFVVGWLTAGRPRPAPDGTVLSRPTERAGRGSRPPGK